MKLLQILLLLLIPSFCAAQEFQVYHGDTINRRDASGKKQGTWRKYYRTDTLYSETHFKDDKPVGLSRTFYDNGRLKAEVNFNREKGKGISYFPDGKIMARGNYKGTEKDSTWIYYHEKADTISAIENYKSGVPHGKWQVFYEDGILAHEMNYINGKKEGVVKQYNMDGRLIFDITYKGGVEEGPSTLYFANGKVREKGIYKQGEREGRWIHYDEQGNEKGEIVYSRGKEVSRKGISVSE